MPKRVTRNSDIKRRYTTNEKKKIKRRCQENQQLTIMTLPGWRKWRPSFPATRQGVLEQESQPGETFVVSSKVKTN